LTHDETVFPDPYAFKPERFLDEKGGLRLSAEEPLSAWGFGRRVCPGQFLAFDTVWLTVATVLMTFTITPHPGQLFSLEDDFETTGVTRFGFTLPCDLVLC
jgi:cytochrome P450